MFLSNAGDASGLVDVSHVFPTRDVEMNKGNIGYSAATGELIYDSVPGPIQTTSAWLEGAHFIRFDSWAVRWLFFFGGLVGSVMIATGLLFWMRARIRKGMEAVSVRVVRGLTIGTTTGIMVSSAVFLAANRMLAHDASALGLSRAYLEVAAFFFVWIVSFVHAGVRNKRAWKDQCWAMLAVCFFAAGMNWVSTGALPWISAADAQWAVLGVDLMLIGTGISAALAATYLGRVQSADPEMARVAPSLKASQIPAE